MDKLPSKQGTTSELAPQESQVAIVKQETTKKPKRAWVFEKARSGRSSCKKCKQPIEKGTYRVGLMTFYPHKNVKWYHPTECANQPLMGASFDAFWYKTKMGPSDILQLKQCLAEHESRVSLREVPAMLAGITGQLDMPRFASALTERYNRFRSFRFGLPEAQKYSQNWRWRCFLATMLVCNTHETAMLEFTDKFFLVYKDPAALDKLRGDKVTTKAWMDFGDKIDLRHIGKKMAFVLRANKNLIDNHGSDVPNNREELEKMNGVGRHVASISMAWCHQEPEFGIDVHVKRILERWGYTRPEMKDIEVEETVKRLIPKEQVGHFSRAFVDHGQSVCGYTPDCSNCYLKHSCPTAAKYLDW